MIVICLPSLSHLMHTIASADEATINSWPEVYLPESDDAAPDDDAALPASVCSTSSSSSEATALIHLESTNACLMMSFCTQKLHDEVMRILLVRVPSIAHCQYTEHDKSSSGASGVPWVEDAALLKLRPSQRDTHPASSAGLVLGAYTPPRSLC